MRFLIYILIAFYLFASHVCAAVYEWKDENGVVNFTDDPGKIPAKFLKKAKKRPSITVESSEPSTAAVPEGREKLPAAEQLHPDKKEVLIGGHNEEWWRSSFNNTRNEIKAIQERLPGKKEELNTARRKVTIYPFPQYRKAYYDLLGEIEKDEARIGELGGVLETLDIEAAKAGVPLDWRR